MSPVWQLCVSQQYHYFVTGDTALLLDLLKVSRFIDHIVCGIGSECRTDCCSIAVGCERKALKVCFEVLLDWCFNSRLTVGVIKSWIASWRNISLRICSSIHPVSWTVNKTMKVSVVASSFQVTWECIDEGRNKNSVRLFVV
jgi:hypothetical protein